MGISRDYYEEVDVLQDALAWVYRQGFELKPSFFGMDSCKHDFPIAFTERRTGMANQAVDLGLPQDMIWRRQSLDPDEIREMLEEQASRHDLYPTAPPSPAFARSSRRI